MEISAEKPGVESGEAEFHDFRKAKRQVVSAFEKEYLAKLLQKNGGNVSAAAREAGMQRSALQRLLRKYTIKSDTYR